MRVSGAKKISKVSKVTRKIIATRAKKKRAMLAAGRALKTKLERLKAKVAAEVKKLEPVTKKLDAGIEEFLSLSFSGDFTGTLGSLVETFENEVENVVSSLDDLPDAAKEIPRFET